MTTFSEERKSLPVSTPTLRDLIAELGRVKDLSPEVIAFLRGELTKLDSLFLAQLACTATGQVRDAPTGDRRLSVEQAAAKLGLSKDYLHRQAEQLPFTIRVGRSLGSSEQGIEKWLRQRLGR